ncbi:hypothetical protein NAT47_10470 [Flavobacterium sp. HXWNR69]|uniref:Uncharacterized protein n=1 Tax=Flavobacterium fragile TaxID=2949085 RepID=A0ABT0TIM9_9FLAO|nr:hypothetical protein [Flavobacterium sp. HXWNR69]MCL9770841.1 hypothetical protein [Flavobacterium sp. HXWNR69]
MENFKLTNHFTIKGISAASGLVYSQNVLFVISDSSSFLYQFDIDRKLLLKFPLVKNAKENIEKENKPDLESITQHGNQLIMLGSGSTQKRNSMFTLDLGTDTLKTQDLTALYQKLKTIGSFTDNQLNIEGAIYAHQTMLLFQRGNSKNSRNGIFIIPNNQEEGIRFIPISLPTLDDIETTFTDAILIGDKIYFLACAENTESTYEDGEVLGTVLGIMHAPTFEIINVQLLSKHQKFEGITLYKESETEIKFLLCEDNDTETLETTIYQLTLKK